MHRRAGLGTLVWLSVLIILSGCKLQIVNFQGPDEVLTGTVIEATIEGTRSGDDEVIWYGLVLQIPETWEVLCVDTSCGRLEEAPDVASAFTAEPGHKVWAGTANGCPTSYGSAWVKLLVGDTAVDVGQNTTVTLKAAVGAVRDGTWETDDPAGVLDFSQISSLPYVRTMTVFQAGADTTPPNPLAPVVQNWNCESWWINWCGNTLPNDVVAFRIYQSDAPFYDVSSMTYKTVSACECWQEIDPPSGDGYYIAVTAVDEQGNEKPSVSPLQVISGTISGTITDNLGAPLSGVPVQAFLHGSDYYNHTVIAASLSAQDGSYSLCVAPGTYIVMAVPGAAGMNYKNEFYDNAFDWSTARPIDIAANATVSGIDIALDPGASISGFVYREDGSTPIEGALVEAYEAESGYYVGEGRSGPDGSYTVPGLPAGKYFLTAWADGFKLESYKETIVWNDAGIVELSEGQTVSGINFTLELEAIETRVTTGNFDQTSAKEVVLVERKSDNTLKLTWLTHEGTVLATARTGAVKEFSVATGNFDNDPLDEVVLACVQGDGNLATIVFDSDGTRLSKGVGGRCSDVHVATGQFDTDSYDEYVVALRQENGTLAAITFNHDGTRIGKGIGGVCSNIDVATGNFDGNASDDEYVITLIQSDGRLAAITFQDEGARIGKGVGGVCSNVSVAVGKFSPSADLRDQYAVSLLQQDGTLAVITFDATGKRIAKGVGGRARNPQVASGHFSKTTPFDGIAVVLEQEDSYVAVIFFNGQGDRIGKYVTYLDTRSLFDVNTGDINSCGFDETVISLTFDFYGISIIDVTDENGTYHSRSLL